MSSLQNYLHRAVQQFSGRGLKGQLLRGGIGSVAIRITNIVLGVALAVVLARALGPEGYGIYAYVFAIVSILAIPAQLGIPRLVVRETAKAQAHENWGLMLGIWRWATLVVVCLSAALVLLSFAVSWIFWDRFSTLQQTTFIFGLLLIPMIALGSLRGAALQGLRRVVLGQLPEHILRPGLLILLLLAAIWWTAHELTAAQAMGLHVVAAGVAFAVGAWLLYRNRPESLRKVTTAVYEPRSWFMATWPLAMTAGMQQINKNTDIIVLGFFLPAHDVGVYRVAVQGAMLVIFGLQAVAMFISPYFARLHAKNDYEHLQRLVTAGARAAFLTALPLVLIFLFWGDHIIRLMFGPNYADAYTPLMILAVGQLINSMFGHVGILLNMTGYERDATRGMAIAAGSNVVLNFVLIPLLGTTGAALATALTLAIWNIILRRNVYRRLRVQCFALSIVKKQDNLVCKAKRKLF